MDAELVEHVVALDTITSDVEMYKLVPKVTNSGLDRIISLGWCIISTWMESEHASAREHMCVSNLSLRFGKGKMRLIVVADVYLPEHESVLLNIDSDDPGSVVGLVPTTDNELWKLRAAAIIGYGPCSNGRPGMSPPVPLPPLTVAGLDIEVSTHARGGSMPLPHDPIISIVISNGCWYDKKGQDVCVCIYTFGKLSKPELGEGRDPIFIKANSSAHAVEIAYATLDKLGYDFVNIHNGFNFDVKHMAACAAGVESISHLFNKRRLGNFGSGMFMKLTNGCMLVDTMYTAMKTSRPGQWSSFGLAHMGGVMDLPPKLDVGGMEIRESDDYDVTDMLVYNSRDSDLHAWLAKEMNLCEMLTMFASVDKSCVQDSISNNVGIMVFCVQQSVCISSGLCLDLSSTSDSDERRIEGGLVLDPVPGVYKGVIMIDGNSLYGTIMSELGIFVDRCASSPTLVGLSQKMGVQLPTTADTLQVGDISTNDAAVVMRTKSVYLGIVRGGPTILSTVIKMFIRERKIARENKNDELAQAYKLSTTATFGATSSAHGALSSKTCGEIITYTARYYLRKMIEVAKWCGYDVIYGDTDSIFVHVKGRTESSCMTSAMRIKAEISKYTKGTLFERVGADVKGNYRSIAISSKKKYEGVLWNGEIETKGLAPVKKDTLPVVQYCVKRVLSVLNSDITDDEKKSQMVSFMGGVMTAVRDGAIPKRMMVVEKRINCQPHLVYVDSNGEDKSILIDIGEKITDVSKEWVSRRIKSALDGILSNMGMNNVNELLFAYESAARRRRLMNNE